MVAFTEVICSLPLYLSTGGVCRVVVSFTWAVEDLDLARGTFCVLKASH